MNSCVHCYKSEGAKGACMKIEVCGDGSEIDMHAVISTSILIETDLLHGVHPFHRGLLLGHQRPFYSLSEAAMMRKTVKVEIIPLSRDVTQI